MRIRSTIAAIALLLFTLLGTAPAAHAGSGVFNRTVTCQPTNWLGVKMNAYLRVQNYSAPNNRQVYVVSTWSNDWQVAPKTTSINGAYWRSGSFSQVTFTRTNGSTNTISTLFDITGNPDKSCSVRL